MKLADNRQQVFIAHGWSGNTREMRPLVDHLSTAGFAAIAIPYPTLVASFDRSVNVVRQAIATRRDAPFHLVGVSFGGLVMRALSAEAPDGLKSLLLIGTPNAGSPLANIARRVAPTPALRRLSTDAPFLPLPPVEVSVGCIAGSRRNMIGRLMSCENDGRVPIWSALAVSHHDSCVLPLGHRALQSSPETHRLSCNFLLNGTI